MVQPPSATCAGRLNFFREVSDVVGNSRGDDHTSNDHETSEAIVRGLVAAAGLQPSEAEIAVLTEAYLAHRAAIDRLHRIETTWSSTPPGVLLPGPP